MPTPSVFGIWTFNVGAATMAPLNGSYSLSGPSTATAGSASTNFTATLTSGSGGVVTPNDAYRGGTFTPSSVTLTSGSPTATFTYTPIAAGPRTIGATNNAGMIDPAGVSLAVAKPAGAQAITAQWLADNSAATASGGFGGPPYVIGKAFTVGANSYSAATYYYLTADATTNFSGFIVGADGVTLDLNGHSITFGNSTAFGPSNGGFESGTLTSVPGWDFTGASTAAICNAADHWLFGSQALRFTSPSTAQVITSDSFTVPSEVVGHTCMATVTNSWGDGVDDPSLTVVLEVVNGSRSSAGGVAATGTSSHPISHGDMCQTSWTPASTGPFFIRITYNPVSNHSLDIDAVRVTASYDVAVIAPGEYELDSGPISKIYANLPAAIQTLYSATRTHLMSFALVNSVPGSGGIVQGTGAGWWPYLLHAVNMGTSVAVLDVTATLNGDEPAGLVMGGQLSGASAACTIAGNTLNCATGVNVSDHYSGPAAIDFSGASATAPNNRPIVVANNTLGNWPQHGVVLYNSGAGSTILCAGNTFTPNIVVSDGSCFVLANTQNFSITNNTVATTNGILAAIDPSAAPGTAQQTGPGVFSGNVASCGMKPNREDGTIGFGRVVRHRNMGPPTNWPWIRGIEFKNETYTYTMNPGDATVAYAFYFSHGDYGDGGNLGYGTSFHDSTVKFIINTTDTSYFGCALNVNNVTAGVLPALYNLTLESNECSLEFSGYSNGPNVVGVTLSNIAFVKSASGAARAYTAIRGGYNDGTVTGSYVIDPTFSGGATLSVAWGSVSPATNSLGIGYTSTVHVQHGGSPVSGATVTLTDSAASGGAAATAFTGIAPASHAYPASNNVGTTDGSGNWAVAIVTDLFTGINTVNNPLSDVHTVYAPIHFAATSGALTGSADATPTTGSTTTVAVA